MKPEPIYGAIGIRLQGHRVRSGLTQEDLAIRLKFPLNTVRRAESGSVRTPLHRLQAIAGALGVKLATLLREAETQ